MTPVTGTFGLLDFTMLWPILAWHTSWNLRTIYLFNFPLFLDRGKLWMTETADTESVYNWGTSVLRNKGYQTIYSPQFNPSVPFIHTSESSPGSIHRKTFPHTCANTLILLSRIFVIQSVTATKSTIYGMCTIKGNVNGTGGSLSASKLHFLENILHSDNTVYFLTTYFNIKIRIMHCFKSRLHILSEFHTEKNTSGNPLS
jgi:hypothetical protein